VIARVLDPRALVVAALVGALAFWLIRRSSWSDLVKGAVVGLLVQGSVRAVGVS
jgi:hypothetical protein